MLSADFVSTGQGAGPEHMETNVTPEMVGFQTILSYTLYRPK